MIRLRHSLTIPLVYTLGLLLALPQRRARGLLFGSLVLLLLFEGLPLPALLPLLLFPLHLFPGLIDPLQKLGPDIVLELT